MSHFNIGARMPSLLSVNSKMRKSGKDSRFRFYNFGIPAFRSVTGIVTCPMAGRCKDGCYAREGSYKWRVVQEAYEWRLSRTLKSTFVEEIQAEIDRIRVRVGEQVAIRIHDSGDFYSEPYTKKWLEIASNNPSVYFYAYTKMIPLFRRLETRGVKLPPNLRVIFSEGGKADHLINPTCDHHSRVFLNINAMGQEGYTDASSDDAVAAFSDSKRIGLVYHGPKSRTWTSH
jgi:hypothetical protein